MCTLHTSTSKLKKSGTFFFSLASSKGAMKHNSKFLSTKIYKKTLVVVDLSVMVMVESERPMPIRLIHETDGWKKSVFISSFCA